MEWALVSTLPDGSDWMYEVKLDGYRAIGDKTSRETILYSRKHTNCNKQCPQIADTHNDLLTTLRGCGTSFERENIEAFDSGRDHAFGRRKWPRFRRRRRFASAQDRT